VMNMERTVSRVRPATDTPAGVRSDLAIITALADRLAPGLFDVRNPAALFAEFTTLTAGTDADCSGITYDRLERERAVRWPAPDEDSSGGYRYYSPAGNESAAAGSESSGDEPAWRFPTSTSRARFSTGQHAAVPEPPDENYPLTLTTARESDGYNTGVRTRTTPNEPGDLTARIHPTTLAATDTLKTDDDETRATVESRRASVSTLVVSDTTVPEGVVWLPIHHPATNRLTIPATDPDSDEPNYKQCAVRLNAPERKSESISALRNRTEPEQSNVFTDHPTEVRQ
jgi:assimilatory nitrate reductase catalytic subunit